MHTCLLLHWVSAPLSDPAKSIRDNLNEKNNTYVERRGEGWRERERGGKMNRERERERGRRSERERERERERGKMNREREGERERGRGRIEIVRQFSQIKYCVFLCFHNLFSFVY